MHQLDVNSAFLNKPLKPPRF